MKKQTLLFLTIILSFNSLAQIWDFEGISKLAGSVNSTAEESLPIFSKDSSALYFIRSFDKENKGGEYDQDIWVSYRQTDGSYSECKPISSLNTKYNNGIVGINKSGNGLYLLNTYEGKKDLVKGIAYTESKGSGWSSPEKIEVPTLDIEGDFYGFHINEDENVMLISYKGPGTIGEEDLYVSLKSGSSWSAPMNLGSTINTTGFEMSPFLSKNQDTLFFSSNGHGGFGDADIFYAVRKGSWTDWAQPVNLGEKINSAKFDACFSYSGSNVYWASNRDTELSDIYTAYFIYPPPIALSCTSIPASKYEGTDGSIDLTVTGGLAPFTFEWSNGLTSEDALNLGKGDYSVIVKDAFGQVANTTCTVTEPAEILIPEVTALGYNNFEFKHYFDYNKNKLSVSRGDLKRFVKDIEKQLKEGRPSITINIYSSASHVPTETYESNEKLTQIRAENMKYDLLEYFSSKDELKGKVNVVISSAIVDGPIYEKDAVKTGKYKPYQFVSLKTE
jgi:hypothetical protein